MTKRRVSDSLLACVVYWQWEDARYIARHPQFTCRMRPAKYDRMTDISTAPRNSVHHLPLSPVHISNNLEGTFDFVEATFDFVERIVRIVAFDNVASALCVSRQMYSPKRSFACVLDATCVYIRSLTAKEVRSTAVVSVSRSWRIPHSLNESIVSGAVECGVCMALRTDHPHGFSPLTC